MIWPDRSPASWTLQVMAAVGRCRASSVDSTHTHTYTTVMGRVLPCPVVLLLLLALTAGGGPSTTTLAEDCSVADTVVKEGQTEVISTTPFTTKNSQYYGDLTLFVKPESGFKGVSLHAWGSDGTHHTAWFPAEEKCFPRDGKWVKFWPMIWTTSKSLVFNFVSAVCWKKCKINTVQAISMNISVVAHGPSRWLTGNPPWQCEVTDFRTKSPDQMAKCLLSPPTTDTTTSGITIAASASAVVVAVAVVLVVVMFCWKRKAATSPHHAQPDSLRPPLLDELVIENDIYEPFDGPANNAALQTFDNDLYESFSGHGRRHDS